MTTETDISQKQSGATLAPLSRRGILIGGSSLAAGLALASCGADKAVSEQLDGKQLATVRKICDLLIPATDTPGALDAGCVQFVAEQAGGLPSDKRREFASGLDRIGQLVANATDWNRVHTAVSAADAKAQAALKQLRAWILLGFYTSEVGATQELRYELVPGRYDPDLPVTADTRSYSSDWFGISLGGRG